MTCARMDTSPLKVVVFVELAAKPNPRCPREPDLNIAMYGFSCPGRVAPRSGHPPGRAQVSV